MSETDDARGIDWWNSLTESERRTWLRRAGSARPVDAWRARQQAARTDQLRIPVTK